MDRFGTATHIEASGEGAVVAKASVDAIIHDLPDARAAFGEVVRPPREISLLRFISAMDLPEVSAICSISAADLKG